MKFKILITALMLVTFGTQGCEKKNTVKTDEQSVPNTVTASNSNSTENLAPEFTINGTNGEKIKLSAYKGKVIILDFWATWCPPCRRGIPDLISLKNQYKDDLVIIGISVDDESTAKDVIPFMKSIGINYKVGYANNEIIQNYGGIQAIPTSFIIDKKGRQVKSFVGLESIDTYKEIINKLVKES